MCSRIWCVRPVSSRQATSVARSPNRSRTSTCVTARRPPTGPIDQLRRPRETRPPPRPDRPARDRGRESGATARGSRPRSSRTPPGRWSRDRCGGRRSTGPRPGRRARRSARLLRSLSGVGAVSSPAGLSTTHDVLVLEHDRVRRQPALVPAARRAPGLLVARASAPPITATTSSPACIGSPRDLDSPPVDEHAADVRAAPAPAAATGPARAPPAPDPGAAPRRFGDVEGDLVRGGHGRAR